MKLTEFVTDNALRLKLEAKGRSDAELGIFEEPYPKLTGAYQQQAVQSAANSVYIEAYHTRKLRLERK